VEGEEFDGLLKCFTKRASSGSLGCLGTSGAEADIPTDTGVGATTGTSTIGASSRMGTGTLETVK